MIKNNVYSILIHVVLSFLGFGFTLMLSQDYFGNHSNLSVLGIIISFVFIVSLYFALGKRLLKQFNNRRKQWLSVSILTIILLILAISFTFVSIYPSNNLIWAVYLIANAAFSFILVKQNDLGFLLFSYFLTIIPSLFLYLGSVMKKTS